MESKSTSEVSHGQTKIGIDAKLLDIYGRNFLDSFITSASASKQDLDRLGAIPFKKELKKEIQSSDRVRYVEWIDKKGKPQWRYIISRPKRDEKGKHVEDQIRIVDWDEGEWKTEFSNYDVKPWKVVEAIKSKSKGELSEPVRRFINKEFVREFPGWKKGKGEKYDYRTIATRMEGEALGIPEVGVVTPPTPDKEPPTTEPTVELADETPLVDTQEPELGEDKGRIKDMADEESQDKLDVQTLPTEDEKVPEIKKADIIDEVADNIEESGVFEKRLTSEESKELFNILIDRILAEREEVEAEGSVDSVEIKSKVVSMIASAEISRPLPVKLTVNLILEGNKKGRLRKKDLTIEEKYSQKVGVLDRLKVKAAKAFVSWRLGDPNEAIKGSLNSEFGRKGRGVVASDVSIELEEDVLGIKIQGSRV